jgi:ribulose-bisphosphate carboxylase large chain
VEFPEDLIPRQEIREHIVGRVASFEPLDAQRFEATIEFPIETAGGELTQLLNVLFGNISLKPGYRLVSFELPDSLLAYYRGPRFGCDGLRERLHVFDRPLLSTAIKPMGLPPAELAKFAYAFALGGIDLIKDDHGLADQSFARFDDRVGLLSEAVRRANRESGLRCIYLPNVTAPYPEMQRRARRARDAGAGGLLISPGLTGLDSMRSIADDDAIGLPILSHPAMLGSFSISPRHGIAHGALYGLLQRLGGADATIFPNYGGRFSFSPDECRDIVAKASQPIGNLRTILPAPAGGMKLERVPELCRFYGKESILLIGGDLHRHGPNLVDNCRQFARLVHQSA